MRQIQNRPAQNLRKWHNLCDPPSTFGRNRHRA